MASPGRAWDPYDEMLTLTELRASGVVDVQRLEIGTNMKEVK